MWYWLSILVVLACAVSMVACALLMWRIGRAMNTKVLPRQLWHLACADFVTCLGMMLYEAFGEPEFEGKTRWLAYVSFFIDVCGFNASILTELHIAAGFAAIFWRSARCIRLLGVTFWSPWVCAVVEASLFLSSVALGVEEAQLDRAMLSLAITPAGITFVLFLSAFVRSQWYPARSQRRAACLVRPSL